MHIQPFQAVYPDMELISSADHFFATVKEKFHAYWDSGFYRRLPQEGFYLHRIETASRAFTGLIACVDIQDYLDGEIKRHEETIAASEQEQVHLLLRRSSQVKPIMLTYQPVEEINQLCDAYIQSHPHFLETQFEAAGELHRFWEISEGDLIQRLQAIFRDKVHAAYISDGHHRTSATALMYQRMAKHHAEDNPFRWLPCAFYATSQLEIYDFNRIIEGLNDLTPVAFMAKLSQVCEIELLTGPTRPATKFELTMFLEREWFRLRWRPEVLEKYQGQTAVLDVSILNEQVLQGVLGIADVRRDQRVRYHQGTKGIDLLKEKTLRSEERLAFCLYPVHLDDFLTISDEGGVMPPKSTWFEPRIRSGLIVRRFQMPGNLGA